MDVSGHPNPPPNPPPDAPPDAPTAPDAAGRRAAGRRSRRTAADGTRVAAGERVGERLRRTILALEVLPGAALSETDIARRFGASRTPIREALRQLDHEGLVVRDGRGYVVRRFTADEVRDSYEVLEALEALSAGLAAERADDDALDRADDALVAALTAQAAGPVEEARRLVDRVHTCIAEAAGNALVSRQIGSLRQRLLWLRRLGQVPAAAELAAIGGQRRIIGAIRRRDRDIAMAESRHQVRWLARQHALAAGG